MTTFKTFGHLGDMFCLTSAAHTYARLTHEPTFIDSDWGITEMYDDDLLKVGNDGVDFDMHPVMDLHRHQGESPCVNYLGCYLRHMMPAKFQERLIAIRDRDLFEPPIVRIKHGRTVIQPYSRNAPNPSDERLQNFVDWMFTQGRSPIYAIGKADTPQTLRGVDYSMLEDSAPAFIRNVAGASFVLTPHSAAAHMAAAYNVPALVWMPDWGENWQLDYPGWEAEKIVFDDRKDEYAGD
jgi:hypothetical protein